MRERRLEISPEPYSASFTAFSTRELSSLSWDFIRENWLPETSVRT